MTINTNVVFKHFEWSGDAYDLALGVLERMQDYDKDDDIYETLFNALDDELIYTNDQWRLMMAYQTPQDANFYNAFDKFENDLMDAINDGAFQEDE